MINFSELRKKFSESIAKLSQKTASDGEIRDYVDLAQKHPEDMRIRFKIAELYYRGRQIQKAITTYQEIAKLYEEKNFVLKAASVYKNMLKLDPTLIDLNIKVAELYLKLDMVPDAANQYRIAIQVLGPRGDKDRLVALTKKLVEIEPTPENRRKLCEVYQSLGLAREAIEQYEILANHYRTSKQYDDLLRVYELILAHKPDNKTMIKDVCILYLRRKEPDHAIRTMERFKVDQDEAFADLYDKARTMKKLLRTKPAPGVNPAAEKREEEAAD